MTTDTRVDSSPPPKKTTERTPGGKPANRLLFLLAVLLPPRFTPESVRYDRRYRTLDKYRFIAGFLALPLAFYALFVISPFVQAIYYSFTDWSGGPVANFIGFDNFTKMWNDERFWDSLQVSVTLAVVAPVVTLVLGMFFAYMITSGGRHRKGQAIMRRRGLVVLQGRLLLPPGPVRRDHRRRLGPRLQHQQRPDQRRARQGGHRGPGLAGR